MSTARTTPRRDFLRRGASLGLPLLVAASVLARGERPAAHDRIALGAIGVGNRGSAVLPEFLVHLLIGPGVQSPGGIGEHRVGHHRRTARIKSPALEKYAQDAERIQNTRV